MPSRRIRNRHQDDATGEARTPRLGAACPVAGGGRHVVRTEHAADDTLARGAACTDHVHSSHRRRSLGM
jgi:hypothetical protein